MGRTGRAAQQLERRPAGRCSSSATAWGECFVVDLKTNLSDMYTFTKLGILFLRLRLRVRLLRVLVRLLHYGQSVFERSTPPYDILG